MGYKAGKDCKLYRNTGEWNDPTWSEMDNIIDLTLPMAAVRIPLATRGDTFRSNLVGLLEAEGISFNIPENEDDADYTALCSAYTGRSTIELAIMDGDIETAGNEGLRADFYVTGFTRNEGLEDAATIDVEVAIAKTDNEATWYTVST